VEIIIYPVIIDIMANV